MALLVAWLILALIVFIIFCIYLFNMVFRGYAPFVETKTEVINEIIKDLELGADFEGNVFELGCGKAGFLHAVEKTCPKAKLVGIEYSLPIYIFSRIQIALQGSRINVLKKNIFRSDVSEADIIYCYLNQPMMEELEGKLKFECKPRARVVSYLYKLPKVQPEKVVDLEAEEKEIERLAMIEQRKKDAVILKKGGKPPKRKEKRNKHEIDKKIFYYEF
jgi:hypothetical protein